MTEVFILAEYCAADFYTGWWLYERDHNDGKPNDRDGWGWMRDGGLYSNQQKVNELCCRIGYEPPAVRRHGQGFAEWFAATFPNGLRVRASDECDDYELVEIVKRRPRQRRGVIRTIRGAAAADDRLCG